MNPASGDCVSQHISSRDPDSGQYQRIIAKAICERIPIHKVFLAKRGGMHVGYKRRMIRSRAARHGELLFWTGVITPSEFQRAAQGIEPVYQFRCLDTHLNGSDPVKARSPTESWVRSIVAKLDRPCQFMQARSRYTRLFRNLSNLSRYSTWICIPKFSDVPRS
jgi:hypothetical protein